MPASPAASAPEATADPRPLAEPVADADADGILDAQDRCPDEPEDRDQFADDDGCVDRDNDGDGILDAHEFDTINNRWTNCDYRPERGLDVDCRDRPEDLDGDEDHDGCPDVQKLDLSQCLIRLPERVPLDRRGRLTVDAPARLDALAAVMHLSPSMKYWVEAHLDKQRDPRAAKSITQRAAQAVIEALVLRGVARDRLEPVGWGDQKPVYHHATAEPDRASNRRVEIVLRRCELPGALPMGDTPETHVCR